jgi:uncharacterized membrane protein
MYMHKNRLETFTDGVFAIVITLLILDIHFPDDSYEHLIHAFIATIPKMLAYVSSFFVIGLYWTAHHQWFEKVAKVNRTFLWLNIVFLMFISFLPFPTSLLGLYPFEPLPIIVYGVNLMIVNLMGFIMLWYLHRTPELAAPSFTEENFKTKIPAYLTVNSSYAIAIAFAHLAPSISYAIYFIVLLALIFGYGSYSTFDEKTAPNEKSQP